MVGDGLPVIAHSPHLHSAQPLAGGRCAEQHCPGLAAGFRPPAMWLIAGTERMVGTHGLGGRVQGLGGRIEGSKPLGINPVEVAFACERLEGRIGKVR